MAAVFKLKATTEQMHYPEIIQDLFQAKVENNLPTIWVYYMKKNNLTWTRAGCPILMTRILFFASFSNKLSTATLEGAQHKTLD